MCHNSYWRYRVGDKWYCSGRDRHTGKVCGRQVNDVPITRARSRRNNERC